MISIAVQPGDFDVAALQARLESAGGGAVATFTGLVRGDGGLTGMTLEHMPGLAEARLRATADIAMTRWPLNGVVIVHRHGVLAPGERIVFVGTASAHRAAALDACAFLIDWLKTDAPFWKKESFTDGRTDWVAPRVDDDRARARWG